MIIPRATADKRIYCEGSSKNLVFQQITKAIM